MSIVRLINKRTLGIAPGGARVAILGGLLLMLFLVTPDTTRGQAPEAAIKSMKWRAIGPANMGGRVTDIVGIPGDASTFYIAGADGGVFKTTNAGVTFEELFTDQRAYSVGALAIAPSDENVIWLGSGEGDPRNSVGYGNGIYRSMDGGKTWSHLGLDKTERIKRILVHPDNPDVACVCALGREWGANPERGVFKTTDAGKTWRKVLYINDDTGCSDLAMEWSNPRMMYAGMWTFRRKPWRFDGGSGATAPYRSMDGGETWEKITNGLPDGPMTRIGVSVAQSQPNTVYLMTEFKEGGTLFRSDDRGSSWKMVSDDPNVNFRPFYYSDFRVDPNNPDHLYSLSGRLMKSINGGKTFERIATTVHGDHQSFWIDPENSNRLLSGSDGGYQVSYDAGVNWDIINNVELSQFYQMDVDNQDPYYIYGGLQDNGTWFGPSNSLNRDGIMKRDWKKIAGGDGYYAVPIPGKEHEVYANLQGGVIFHVDTRYGNVRSIHPYPKIIGSAGDAIVDHKYRFNWDSPILISPHDPNTVYFGGNVLFRTTDRGDSWEEISPDLTTNDKSKQLTSGGEIYQDNTAAEFHTTILTVAESPVEKGVIWVGTDDGNLQLTRDGGANWTNMKDRVKGLPAFAWIAKIHASEHDGGTAFMAVDHHRSDDFTPYAFVTTDYGRSWTKIVNGLPQDDYVKVIRQDPKYEDVLYIGMEHGIYISWDKGQNWSRINNNMPPVSVRDLRIQAREGDLIAATHGRGVWILDDIEPLRQLKSAMGEAVNVFPTRRATLWHMYTQGENHGERVYRAKNPEFGAYINLYLSQKPQEAVVVSIKDAGGNVVRTIEDTTLMAGVNRIVWDLRIDGATKLDKPITGGWRSLKNGPQVLPGTYTASIAVNGQSYETTIEVRSDPRIEMSTEDYQLKHKTLLDLRDLLSQANEMINQTDRMNKQLSELQDKLSIGKAGESYQGIEDEIKGAMEKITDLQDDVLRRPPPGMNYRQRPRLRDEIRSVTFGVDGATAKPTQPQLSRVTELQSEAKAAMTTLQSIISKDIAEINQKVADMPQILIETTSSP